jgi:ParB family chromosome partitioning protein
MFDMVYRCVFTTHTTGGSKMGDGATEVAIELVDADETNVRSRVQGIEELAASIRMHGIIQPLVGTRGGDGRVRLIAGHRRLAAAKLAGLECIPMIFREVEATVAKELQLVENVQREDLPALAVAEALPPRALPSVSESLRRGFDGISRCSSSMEKLSP